MCAAEQTHKIHANRFGPGRRSAVLAALCVALVAVPISVHGTADAGAATSVTVVRFAGANRYETAKLMAADLGAAQTAVVARGDDFPDALAGAYAAGVAGGPILLVTQNTIPDATTQALSAAGASRVLVLGGPAAIAPGIDDIFRKRGIDVVRLAGANRYATSAAIAERGDPTLIGRVEGKRTAIVASGTTFPDALAAGPLATGNKMPILLTPPDALNPDAKATLAKLGIERVLLVGGTAAVSKQVEDDIVAAGMTVSRLAGPNRSATSVEINLFARANLGFTSKRVGIVRGDQFADALAYAGLGGRIREVAGGVAAPNGIELIASATSAGPEVLNDLRGSSGTLTTIEIGGGPSAVSQDVEAQLLTAATAAVDVVWTTTDAPPGGAVTGTINGTALGTITGTGCGLSGQAIRTGPGPFSIPIAASVPAGPCDLTLTVTFEDGRVPAKVTQTIDVGGAGGGGAAAPLRTNGPDLAGAQVLAATVGDGQPNSVLFHFDAPVTTDSATAGRLSLHGYDSNERRSAAGVAADASDPSNVVALFPDAIEVADMTLAVADGAAVKGASGQASVLGAVPLMGSTFARNAGRTAAPDLVGVAVDAASGTVAFVFDQQLATVTGASSFGYYDAAGVFHEGSGQPVTVGSRIQVGFAGGITNAVRFVARPGAVVSGGQLLSPAGSFVAGDTARPDLVAATRVESPNLVLDFTFDEAVRTSGGVIDPKSFAAFTDSGAALAGTKVTASSERVLRVDFGPAGALAGRVVSAAALDGAVAAGDVGPPSSLGAVPVVGLTVGPGPTDGPDPLAALYDPSTERIRVTFDDAVDATRPVDPSRFFAVTATGEVIVASSAVEVAGANVTVAFPTNTIGRAVGVVVANSHSSQGPAGGGDAVVDITFSPAPYNANSPGALGGGPAAATT